MTQPRPNGPAKPRLRTRRCPICRAPAVPEWRPFCSRRCADADLARWLAGDYRVPSDEADADADNEPGDEGEQEHP
ncbi:MAG: DNA gyrase inhibitor YacG [Rhodospirillales bacterium]